jgi:hypothetical protein
MCQCGCGDFDSDLALRVSTRSVMSLRVYRGCADCHEGIALDLSFFDKEGVKDWLSHCKIESAPKPDRSGGNDGMGVNFPLFEVRDMIEAAKREGPSMIGKRDGYKDLTDWLKENGLRLIQDALRIAQERYRTTEPNR